MAYKVNLIINAGPMRIEETVYVGTRFDVAELRERADDTYTFRRFEQVEPMQFEEVLEMIKQVRTEVGVA